MSKKNIISRERAWDFAIGLAQVDGGTLSPEVLELVEMEKRGEIRTKDMLDAVLAKYNNN